MENQPKKDENKSDDKKDFSTAILDRKKAPHRLMAEEFTGPNEDNSVVQLTQKKMDELGILKSETVLLKGKKRKETLAVCIQDDTS